MISTIRVCESANRFPGLIYQLRLESDGTIQVPFLRMGHCDILEADLTSIPQDANLIVKGIHPDDYVAFEQSVRQSAQTLNLWHWQGRYILLSGEIRWFQGISQPEPQPDEAILWNGQFMDITLFKQTEAKLQQLNEELEATRRDLKRTQTRMIQSEKMTSLGQLVAGVAHEINNPVNFIYGNLNHASNYSQDLLNLIDLYQQHYPQPSAEIEQEADAMEVEFLKQDLPKLLNSMKVGADRIQKIVTSLRNFSHMDEAEKKPVNIHDGIDSTLMILQNRLKAKPDFPEITVIRIYANLPPVACYAGQLNQVFMNLLTNAIDALEESRSPNPEIRIQTELLDNTCVKISILDNGAGIPSETQQRIFDPFFTTKPLGKGTGMGMSISHQIITENHGGRIRCYSQPDQGTEFVIEIPISDALAQ